MSDPFVALAHRQSARRDHRNSIEASLRTSRARKPRVRAMANDGNRWIWLPATVLLLAIGF